MAKSGGSWKKGESGNPNGRPRSSEIEELRRAIKSVERKKKKRLFAHFIERAFKSDAVLVATIKKLVADKTQVEGILDGDLNITVISAVPRPKDED